MASSSKLEGSRFPITTVATFARLKSLAFASRRGKSELVFPPPSWEIDKLTIGRAQESFESPSQTSSGTEVAAEPAEAVGSTEAPVEDELEEPEPLTFAQRIRDLIESLPIPGTSTTSRQPTTDVTVEAQVLRAQDGSQGPPISPGVDRDLVKMLSSEKVMNGEEGEKGEGKGKRQSMWSILSVMQLKGREKGTNTRQAFDDDTRDGLMMYSPLEPTNGSQVELAEMRPATDVPAEPDSRHNESPDKNLEWMPSTTQISVYTTWWGYRLYLPPPVMDTLDSVSLKATAQAAMVTSALKWLLTKIPDTLVPAQYKAPLQLLKRLSPVVGFIGVFIAWSWGRIKAHDKGNGVVLTATWLLPVALIPMAWDAGESFGPVHHQEPTPSQEERREAKKVE